LRVLELRLVAFGPFTNQALDLSGEGPALHLILGHNETGKSTTLRALSGLLYGIPENTPDAHLHPMPALRIGARLALPDGSLLEITRKKGRKNTLLGSDGMPMDEERLRAALGHLGRESFATMFGLDHRSLRAGARALLEGGGELGESLFDAGVGGRSIRAVLGDLEREGDGIYKPQASKPALNAALKELKAARKRVSDSALSAQDWIAHEKGIAELSASAERLRLRRDELEAEKMRLERARRVLPLLARRREALAELAALGQVAQISDEAMTARIRAQQAIAEADRDVARLADELQRLEDRHASFDVPESLLGVAEGRIEELSDRLSVHRKASLDRSKLEGEARALETEARTALRRLGKDTEVEQVEALRVPVAMAARIDDLIDRYGSLEADLRHARAAHADLVGQLEKLEAGLSKGETISDTTRLGRSLERARKLGDVAEQVARLEREQERVAADAADAARRLGLVDGPADALAALQVPSVEAAEVAEEVAKRLERTGEKLEERREKARERLADADTLIDEIERLGDVPTDEQLDRARADRQALWKAIMGGADPRGEDGERFSAAVDRADLVADRLRREAERVARHAAAAAAASSAREELEEIDRERAEQAERVASEAHRWHAQWSTAGVEPRSPTEMRAWLARHDALVQAWARRERVSADLGALRDRVSAATDELRAALEDLGCPGHEPSETLGELVDRAAAAVNDAAAHARDRRVLEDGITDVKQQAQRSGDAAVERERELEGWRLSWHEAVAALGLGPDALPDEARAVLREIEALFERVDEAARTRGRIAGIDRDAASLAESVGELVKAVAPDLVGSSIEDGASELIKRHRKALSDRKARDECEHQIEQRRAELVGSERARSEGQEDLWALMAAVGADSLEALVEAEQRSAAARKLREDVADLERQIRDQGDGAGVEALEEETAGLSGDAARVSLGALGEELAAVNVERDVANGDLRAQRLGLEQLRQRSAADAAEQVESRLAAVQDLAHRYVRLRLGAAILRREIERYREQNQGPLLTRASELFPRLTLGRYRSLVPGVGASDEPVLRCFRADGREVDVSGLSDGACDQLYLALRLASLERHVEHNGPVPVVLDDVLVHFDDDRARAALTALGDLARHTQVLFFTHHRRLVELARTAVPRAMLREHELDAGTWTEAAAETAEPATAQRGA